MQVAVVGVDEVVEEEMATLTMRLCWMKMKVGRRGPASSTASQIVRCSAVEPGTGLVAAVTLKDSREDLISVMKTVYRQRVGWRT